jgi:anti-sigma B factor antagonist
MPDFDVSREQGVDDSHAWLLTITGEVDATTAQPLDDAFDEVLALGAQLVTLDLTDVAFLDSTGLRSIVRASNLLAEHDGRLVVAGLSGAAQRVLEISGLIDRLADQHSDDDGIDSDT